MKYVVLVSHGTFAPGLHSVLKMLAGGEREDVISVGLEDGMSADEFAEKFSNAISKITEDDEIILLGDIVGGSPLTNAIEQVSNKGLIGQTVIFGGMNLAMALTATLMKDGVDTDMLKDSLINEAKDAVKEFVMTSANDDEEDDLRAGHGRPALWPADNGDGRKGSASLQRGQPFVHCHVRGHRPQRIRRDRV